MAIGGDDIICGVVVAISKLQMDSLRLLLLTPVMMSVTTPPPPPKHSDAEFTWHKNSSQPKYISSDENKRIHYRGAALFILNVTTEDSGFYVAQHNKRSGKCSNYHLRVEVFKASQRMNRSLLYMTVDPPGVSKKVRCPLPVSNTCSVLNGSFTWYKDFSHLQGQNGVILWVHNATKHDEGIYTCLCTWQHNQRWYNSSGSRELIVEEMADHHPPIILSPVEKEMLVDEGKGIKLVCSILCGSNVQNDCLAHWHVNQADTYKQTIQTVVKNSTHTVSTAILSIGRLSAKDFHTVFECEGKGYFDTVSTTLTLTPRGTIIPVVIGGVCAFLFCGLAALMVRFFAVDLALLFRPYLPQRSHNDDAKLYDAYVIYQRQSGDKVAEDTLCLFVSRILPSVLEEKCGYRLFIHGRDDIPGEDHIELVEDHMQQSRRLMVLLTPGSGAGLEATDQHSPRPQDTVVGGIDWQVGLHHALIQREMSVILIQLGKVGPQGYTHLPPGLQHLIVKSTPISWPENSKGAASWNSRFWKRVRYLMPARPASKFSQSAVI
ncbi:interleukin-1 receptor-like 1 [Aulostomus maculatus]